jgi:hypothetical protein
MAAPEEVARRAGFLKDGVARSILLQVRGDAADAVGIGQMHSHRSRDTDRLDRRAYVELRAAGQGYENAHGKNHDRDRN